MSKITAPTAAGGNLPGSIAVDRATTVEPVTYKFARVRELDIFYREAGPKTAPTLLLLHGFPSSSHMFRDLIPLLATTYHVVAPDYPGFGHSSAPSPDEFTYTFGNLADVVDEFTAAVGLTRYVIYMQDYGGPVGMRLALKHPERVRGFVVQNAVVNVEGWSPEIVRDFTPAWTHRTAVTEEPLRAILQSTRFQYTQGATRADRINPDAWLFDQALLDRPGSEKIQLELLYQYKDNIARYPDWQRYLRAAQPPILVAWGDNDPIFTIQGRDFFKTLVATAEIRGFDAGHFALETHGPEIAAEILAFLDRLGGTL